VSRLNRRELALGAAGVVAGGFATIKLLPEEMLLRDRRPPRSRVAIIPASAVPLQNAGEVRVAEAESCGVPRRRGGQH
jgi:hypothetical protein